MNWCFAPDTPTKPGLYVATEFGTYPMTLLLRWSPHNPGWRHGAQRVRVDAFLGPIVLPTRNPEHAEVEHLFAPPARDVPIPRAPKRRTSQDRRR